MNLVSFFLLLLLIEMEIHAKRRKNEIKDEQTKTPPNVIRIPLTSSSAKLKQNNSGGARSTIFLDDQDWLHFGTITIGNEPGKKDVKVTFNTGSSYSWVFSSFYSPCEPNSRNIQGHTLFDSQASSTIAYHNEEKPELFTYGIGWAFGTWCTDTILISESRVRQKFLEVVMASDSLVNTDSDGTMGLAYNSKQESFVTKLCKEIKGENKFSFYFPRYRNVSAAELHLCGEDKSKYVPGTMKYANETEPGKWIIKVDKVQMESFAGNVLLTTQFALKIDTGTNRFGMPDTMMNRISALVQATPLENSPANQVDCNNVKSLPNLTFTIDGTNYVFTGEDYTRRSKYPVGYRCRLLIHSKLTTGNYWTVGDIFIRKYYTVFDIENHRIGFAPSTAN